MELVAVGMLSAVVRTTSRSCTALHSLRDDGYTVRVTTGRLAVLSRKDLRTLASSMIVAQPELDLSHFMGVPHKQWSYKSVVVKYVTGMLVHKPAHFDRYGWTEAGMVEVTSRP